MSRTQPRPIAHAEHRLVPCHDHWWSCGARRGGAYTKRRKIVTLDGLLQLHVPVRRCPTGQCVRYRQPYRPEAEGTYALPQGEFGLDVIALVGTLRFAHHRSIPAIRAELDHRGVPICERSVTEQLYRYAELLALRLMDHERLRACLQAQGFVVLALDGLQPDVGHAVLWVLRDCVSGAILRARSLLGATAADLASVITEVRDALPVPIRSVISEGQPSIRKAVAQALPGVPHHLGQFHYLREAATPIDEADRHAKKELQQAVRGVRPIERVLETREAAEAEAVRGYCLAVRSALTDDGRPPLCASGLQVHARRTAIHESIARVAAKRGASPPNSRACTSW